MRRPGRKQGNLGRKIFESVVRRRRNLDKGRAMFGELKRIMGHMNR